MTRADLIAKLVARFPHMTAKQTESAVRVIIDTLCTNIAQGSRIEIRGFGSFSLRSRPARTGRNPKTGEAVFVAQKCTPHFKPGKSLRERVNQKSANR